MSLHRLFIRAGIIGVVLMLTACSSSNNDVGPRKPKPMDTSGKSPNFISGAEDGCETAKGDYSKNHEAFNNDIDYHEGWFAGRGYCQA